MPQPLPIFYTKPGCPWCTEALAFFEAEGMFATKNLFGH